MLSKFDDFCIHQTADPVAEPGTSDRNYYDRYWFNGFDTDGGFCFEVGFGLYPNRYVMDGHFSVVLAGKQYAFHASRRAPLDRSETQVAALQVEVVEPMRVIRVALADNETGISCDLTFSAITAATQEPRNFLKEGVHVIMDTTRFTQFGRWQGWFSIDGQRHVVQAQSTLGVRDKSWGVRPVGEPAGGAPGLMNAEPGIYWNWNPIIFPQYCTHFATFQDHDGKPTQVGGCRLPRYEHADDAPIGEEPGQIEMDEAAMRISWRKGTRHAESAQLSMSGGGQDYLIDLEPILPFFMLAIGYQHPEWGHAVWKGDQVVEREDWVLKDLDPLDYKYIHQHQIVKARYGELEGMGILETVVFGRHDPSGFKDILDGAV